MYITNKFDKHLLNKLLNIITVNFNDIDFLSSDSSETMLTLYTLLGLGGSSISIYDQNHQTMLSKMTYKIMERIPLKLKDSLIRNNNLIDIIKKLGIKQFEIIISNMFKWPQTNIIHLWVIEILKILKKMVIFNYYKIYLYYMEIKLHFN